MCDIVAIVGTDAPSNYWIIEVDVEWSGAPDVAPAGGEDLRAGAGFGEEKGHDVAEDVVGEVADQVDQELFLFHSPLLGSGDHPMAAADGVETGNRLECRATRYIGAFKAGPTGI